MTDQDERKLIAIRGIDSDIYHRARQAALQAKQTIGHWITEAINQRINRDKGGQ